MTWVFLDFSIQQLNCQPTPYYMHSIKQVGTPLPRNRLNRMAISAAGTITISRKDGYEMMSVGIDVSKGKRTICILKPYGEIVCSPFEIEHTEKDLGSLADLLQKLDGEIRAVMEATGIQHLSVLTFLLEKGYYVPVVNPYAMKKYAKDNSIRGAKTDRIDSITIANYGIEK